MKSTELLKLDMKNISREVILLILIPVPVFFAFLLRFGLPLVVKLVDKWVDLYTFSPLFLIFFIIMGPLLTGMISGMMLVDEADEHVIPAISVTPLGRNGYIKYKLFTPFIWTFIILLPVPFLSGLIEINYLYYLPIILILALGAPLEALLIAVLASNKIEAMAMGKMTGLLCIAPFISWFTHQPWKFLGGLIPSFWAAEAYFDIINGGNMYFYYILLGLFISTIWIYLLLKKYNLRADK